MKKIFYSFLFLFFTVALQAQNVRKIPFLPYLQAGGTGGETADTPFQNDAPRSLRKVATIYFSADQASIRKEDLGTLQSVAAQAVQQQAEIFLYSYVTPEMPNSIGDERLKSTYNALKDINISLHIYSAINQRVNPVITPHRVEIFLK